MISIGPASEAGKRQRVLGNIIKRVIDSIMVHFFVNSEF